MLLTEADSHLGMANRLAAPLAQRVALAFPIADRTGSKYIVTGRPVGDEVRGATRDAGRAALGIPADARCVLVAGGSQGARTINHAVAGAFGDGPPFELIHLAGARQVDEVREILRDRNPGPRYRLLGYLDDFHSAVAAADLVVSRAGGSVFELAAIGRPAILVPYPYATADHQTKNAQWLVDAGAAVLVPDRECTAERIAALVDELLCRPGAPGRDGRRRSDRRAARRRRGHRGGGARARRRMTPRRIHLVGIGGAGMSGLARLAAQAGYTVSGTDRDDSEVLVALRGIGVAHARAHAADAMPPDAETVVVSTAIAADNPELVRARARACR